MNTIRVMRDGRPATDEELQAAVEGRPLPPSACSPQIVQILIAPNDAIWQGRMMGLDSSGAVHSVNPDGRWEPFVPPLNFQENKENTRPNSGRVV